MTYSYLDGELYTYNNKIDLKVDQAFHNLDCSFTVDNISVPSTISFHNALISFTKEDFLDKLKNTLENTGNKGYLFSGELMLNLEASMEGKIEIEIDDNKITNIKEVEEEIEL